MKKNLKIIISCTAAMCIFTCLSACSGKKAQTDKSVLLNPSTPVTVDIWNYYNGDQKAAFDNLVSEFNDTVGLEKGIIVNSTSQSNISTLADELLDSANGKAGSHDMPNIAAIYPETVYILYNKGLVAELDPYFSESELAEYVPSFIEEGRLVQNGPLVSFPVSKSTEVFVCNKTDWDKFEQATGTTLASAMTIEGMVKAAETYYNWTDSLTPNICEDGKALYGRDSLANYIYISSAQLGHELFVPKSDGTVTVDLDRDTFKTIWDNYYIPYINGYFGSYASYCSDDAKIGSILAMTGSSSGLSYFPTAVTLSDDTSHNIDVVIDKPIMFENKVKNVAVQQGAGYCVLKSTEQEEYASVEFLKWFTSQKQNLDFSIKAGYSPVKTASNAPDLIKEMLNSANPSAKQINILNSLLVSSDIYNTWETYSCKPFDGSKDVRSYLEESFDEICKNDRKAVIEKVNSGMTRQAAVGSFSTNEYFNAWFDAISTQVNNIVAK
ncbi:MAG: extracellular solute-binding protein [Candidatus Metalachnospira sp.]|nr:extracellular solute-binding protein [Candidatus Metalachnospira sp.]